MCKCVCRETMWGGVLVLPTVEVYFVASLYSVHGHSAEAYSGFGSQSNSKRTLLNSLCPAQLESLVAVKASLNLVRQGDLYLFQFSHEMPTQTIYVITPRVFLRSKKRLCGICWEYTPNTSIFSQASSMTRRTVILVHHLVSFIAQRILWQTNDDHFQPHLYFVFSANQKILIVALTNCDSTL